MYRCSDEIADYDAGLPTAGRLKGSEVLESSRVVVAAMRAAGERPELPHVLYELEERIGPLTAEAIEMVGVQIEKPLRTVEGLEWYINTGRRLRDEWQEKLPRASDPSLTPREGRRLDAALALRRREAATFARLMELMAEVAEEPSQREIPVQAVLDQAWKRLDAQRVIRVRTPRN